MKKNGSTMVLIMMFFVGLCVLLYPAVSDYWNSKVQSHAIMHYEESLKEMTSEDYGEWFAAADAYNARLREIDQPLKNHALAGGYEETMNVSGTGIIGYIDIEKIRVELPVYHGTSEGVLNIAAGHLEGTSLPVGGESTHAAISAHRGLPSARLFTELDKLKPGDVFTITVLDRVLTYQVDRVLIVKPSEVEPLAVEKGRDYCTLVTCTPYGVNSHRLLVRGVRVATATEKPPIFVANEGYRIDPIIVTPVVAMPMLLTALAVLLVKYRRKR